MPDYTFPGAEHHQAMMDRLAELNAGEFDFLKENADSEQARWDRAHTEYSDPFQIQLRDAIWRAMHGGVPYYSLDTMEVASMRCRVFDVLDAIWPLVAP